jgi:hypothetical protein
MAFISVRPLSLSYEKIGDVLAAQGNLPEGLKSFRDPLAIRNRLAQIDPGNTGWQHDLSVSYSKLADVCRKSQQAVESREAFAAGRSVIARLAAQFPDQVQWKRDLAWFDQQIATLKN